MNANLKKSKDPRKFSLLKKRDFKKAFDILPHKPCLYL